MKPTERKLPEGFKCTACAKDHKFPAYVYAHWSEPLVHTCECGTRHEILRGAISPIDDE